MHFKSKFFRFGNIPIKSRWMEYCTPPPSLIPPIPLLAQHNPIDPYHPACIHSKSCALPLTVFFFYSFLFFFFPIILILSLFFQSLLFSPHFLFRYWYLYLFSIIIKIKNIFADTLACYSYLTWFLSLFAFENI